MVLSRRYKFGILLTRGLSYRFKDNVLSFASTSGAFLKQLASKFEPEPEPHSARFHLQHGPIDIIATLEGDRAQIFSAMEAVWARFETILPELVSELTLLRSDTQLIACGSNLPEGKVARRMFNAVLPFAVLPSTMPLSPLKQAIFITPMAAVAGSVADELLTVASVFDLRKVIFNNGGDIAICIGAGEVASIKLLAPLGMLHLGGSPAPFRAGVATSGWSGRSFSLGIADAVTVVAATASEADAAATIIANEVGQFMQHPAIERRRANELKDDSDLGSRWVTTRVGRLPQLLVTEALAQGEMKAQELLQAGLIQAASLSLQEESVIVTDKLFTPSIEYRRAA
jgi:uncharacterized protein